eukprot:jgi/Undpi1/2145/HiC_scaffold_12.g05531.m1
MKVPMIDTLGVLLLLGCTLPLCTAFLLPSARPISAAIFATSSLKSPRSGGRTLLSRAGHASDRPRASHVDGAAQEGVSIDIFDALMSGNVDAVKEYVNAGGDCSVRDSIGDTPLMVAVESELTPTVAEMLVKQGGADVNEASETTGETPLHVAAYYGFTPLLKALIEDCDANLETRNRKGETPLNLACFWGNMEAVDFLLAAGADPNNLTNSNELPGDSFDSVFVPETDAEEEDYQSLAEESDDDARPEGPRELILSMLRTAREARKA